MIHSGLMILKGFLYRLLVELTQAFVIESLVVVSFILLFEFKFKTEDIIFDSTSNE